MHDIVIENTMKMLFDDELIAELVDTLFEMQLRDNTVIPQLQKQLEDTQKGIENILNAIQQGVLTPSTKERLEALEETKDKLEISILQEQIKKPLLTKEQIHFWIYKFRELDFKSQAGKERLIDSFVNAVYVYSDKIILTFNYKDTTITLNLADLAGSDLDAVSPFKIREVPSARTAVPGFFMESRESNPLVQNPSLCRPH